MQSNQIALFDVTDTPNPKDRYGLPDLHSYDTYIVAISGKDSIACLLHLIEEGVDRSKIELWHHLPDGREGSTLFDWPVTEAYEQALADAFGLPLYFSWREGGLETEMLKKNDRSKPIWFETPDGLSSGGGVLGKISTRRRFPQQTANLQTRWCSDSAKISVSSIALNNQKRFLNSRTLFCTGERAEESGSRSNYSVFEPHRCDRRDGKLARHVDHYRPVHSWKEADVWEISRRFGVVAHPAYHLSFGRLSCQKCIFASKNQWATIEVIDPAGFEKVANYEDEFGWTIDRIKSVREQAAEGTPYAELADTELVKLAMSTTYDAPILVDPQDWQLPAGAFGESNGPT